MAFFKILLFKVSYQFFIAMKIETLVFFDVETIGMRDGPFINSNHPPTIFRASLHALKEKGYLFSQLL